MKKYVYSIAVVFFLSLFIASPVFAGATLHIGFGADTECATGCGGDPNTSGAALSDTFNIYQNSEGVVSTVEEPVWLIIGVPDVYDQDLFSYGSITGIDFYEDYSGYLDGDPAAAPTAVEWTYQGLADEILIDGTPTPGDGKLDPKEEVYSDVLGLEPPGDTPNDSNNWTNWHDTELAYTGIDADFFGIYVFFIESILTPGGLLDITFIDETTVPLGSYVIAFGRGSSHHTPFTESGMQVPEPSTLLLLGSGLIGLGIIGRRFGRRA